MLELFPGLARAGLARARLTEAAADPRAGPVARRPRRPDARRGGHHVRQPATAAVRRGVQRPAREPCRRAAYGTFVVCGKHCESGDVMIHGLPLPEPRRGDLLAVPGTGAYTLAMASNYNSVPRPAAVLVGDGEARIIRRRESIDDLFALEA